MTNKFDVSSDSDVLDAHRRVVKAKDDLQKKYEDLDFQKKLKITECASLYDAPLPLSDVKQFLLSYIDAKKREYLPTVREMIMDALYPREIQSGVKPKPINAQRIRKELGAGPGPFGFIELMRRNKNWQSDVPFYCFFADQIKNLIDEEFDGLEIRYLPEHAEKVGVSLAEREAREVELKCEIADIESEMLAVRKRIYALGV